MNFKKQKVKRGHFNFDRMLKKVLKSIEKLKTYLSDSKKKFLSPNNFKTHINQVSFFKELN